MFRTRIYFLIFVFLTLTVYTAWIFHKPTSKNYRDYNKLMSYSNILPQSTSHPLLAKQYRHQISKQLLFQENNSRLQWRVHSPQSEVLLEQAGNSLELVEKLQGTVCKMQEKINSEEQNSYQLVRCLEAEKAVYNYKHKQLSADQVRLQRYKIPHTDWVDSLSPYSPFMQGQAQSVQLTFSQEPLFKAKGFQAAFQEWE